MTESGSKTEPRPDRSGSDAPRVTAQGAALLGQRLEAMARTLDAPMQPDAGLADILAELDMATAIPPVLVAAVAEILAHLHACDAELGKDTAASAIAAADLSKGSISS